jgi:hypothetical protein
VDFDEDLDLLRKIGVFVLLDRGYRVIFCKAAKPNGARELWICRGDRLLIYGFDGREYREQSGSGMFPWHDVKDLMVRFIDRGWEVGSSVAVREFEEFLRKNTDQPTP